jgi:hypothetical protein
MPCKILFQNKARVWCEMEQDGKGAHMHATSLFAIAVADTRFSNFCADKYNFCLIGSHTQGFPKHLACWKIKLTFVALYNFS